MTTFDGPREFTVTTPAAYIKGRCVGSLFLLVREGRVVYTGNGPPEGLDPALPAYACGALIEPLADAHVHLFLTGSHDPEERRKAATLDEDGALERILSILSALRRRGIRAVRDGGDPRGLALRAARIANREPWRYATVAPSGEPLYRRGFYGGFLGRGVESTGEMLALLKKNVSAGATQIKVLATGLNSLELAGGVGKTQFTDAEIRAIAACARSEGLGLMVHANGPSRSFLLPGVHSLEHGFWMEEGDFTALAERGIRWTPTMGAWKGVLGAPGLTPSGREVVEATDRRQRWGVGLAGASGVRVASGSDAGTPGVEHLTALARELANLAAAGLGVEGALAASTVEAAALASANEREGLREGGRAGFVMLDHPPTDDFSGLTRPLGVFIGGILTLNDLYGED